MKPRSRSGRARYRVRDLFVDREHVQRTLVPIKVKQIINSFDPNGIGVLTVNKRADGQLSVLDGQHRVLALMDMGKGALEVDCKVYYGLSLEEEAQLFRVLNNTSKPRPWDDFKAALTAHDPETVAINRMVSDAGLRVADQKYDGCVCAVGALRKSYRQDPEALRRTLGILTEAWGTQADAFEAPLISGVAYLCGRYNGELDDAALTQKLAKLPAGPRGMLGRARGVREFRPMSVARAVAVVSVDLYNHGKRTQQLEAL